MVKKIAVLMMIGIWVLLCAGGCKKMEEKKANLTKQEVKQSMLDYLNEKYDATFLCQSIEYQSWSMAGMESMLAYPEGGSPYDYFSVHRITDEDGNITMKDGYVGFKMKKEFRAIGEPLVTKYFPDSTIYVGYSNGIDPEAEEFGSNTTFEEYKKYADQAISVGITIYLPAETKSEVEQNANRLLEELKTKFPIGHLSISGYSQEDYETDIVQDVLNTQQRGKGYPTRNQLFWMSEEWGTVNYDYKDVKDE